jgi:hypothetical protein
MTSLQIGLNNHAVDHSAIHPVSAGYKTFAAAEKKYGFVESRDSIAGFSNPVGRIVS